MTVYKSNFDRRKQRIRRKLQKCVRLSVHKSNYHIYAQIIDDNGMTLVAASTLEKDIASQLQSKNANISAAAIVGLTIGKRAVDKGIYKIVFDRSGYKYHGKIKALANAAREAGLLF